ncbi:glycosyltransferase family 2 protein [Cupriavidus sp. IK-TO18]|uniref:glycosyltransferase family 2 protein n=1 Tax=Cupriavidus sp. IK-TO18 TaxID=2782182 RepID=UPI001898CBAA|nr:glycosyltransferase [Cupriavidus sp. IK-TO18]MBF6991760.1 glycosyltransferase [Cupriavidus sp. IK-TO18]
MPADQALHAAPPGASLDISVVVLTHNRRDTVRHALRQLSALPERPPLVVVDNASDDGTSAMVRDEFPHATLLRCQRNLGAAGRNLGARWARTPYVAFCDDDCWWTPGSLATACAMFRDHPRVAALTARILVGECAREDPACARMADSPLPSAMLPGRAILGLMAGATAFRTEAFRQAGGYHPRFFIGGEETLLALDLAASGWHLVYAPQLVVHHHPSPLRDGGRRRSLLARNAVWAAWLRLPWRMALEETAAELPGLLRSQGWRGIAEVLKGMAWVMRERRVIPRELAALRRDLRGR